MYPISERIKEAAGWRVRVSLSDSEAVFMWFESEPDQAAVDLRAAAHVLRQQIAAQEAAAEELTRVTPKQVRAALESMGRTPAQILAFFALARTM